jgi:hypothetical protein
MLTVPQVAVARDNCNRQENYSRSGNDRRYSYQDRAERGYRNSAYGYQNGRYQNDRYDRYQNNTYRDNGYYSDNYGDYRATRSPGKSAAIIGGSAAAGAAIGGLTQGVKGAAIGAAVGGVGGLIYDRTTRNNGNRW